MKRVPRDSVEGRARNARARENAALRRLRQTALTTATLREACAANLEDVLALRKIIVSTKPVRNAAALVRAIEIKWAYGRSKPKGTEAEQGGLSLGDRDADPEPGS